jgi:hypothetical protein
MARPVLFCYTTALAVNMGGILFQQGCDLGAITTCLVIIRDM